MGCITGKEYLERIGQLKTNVWLNRSKVNVLKCPSFKGVLNSQAKLYDIQNQSDKRDLMTYKSPIQEIILNDFFAAKDKR